MTKTMFKQLSTFRPVQFTKDEFQELKQMTLIIKHSILIIDIPETILLKAKFRGCKDTTLNKKIRYFCGKIFEIV